MKAGQLVTLANQGEHRSDLPKHLDNEPGQERRRIQNMTQSWQLSCEITERVAVSLVRRSWIVCRVCFPSVKGDGREKVRKAAACSCENAVVINNKTKIDRLF